jgi:antagonist of KipI
VRSARALEVLDAGLLTTVQDRGRFGYAAWGVPAAGALDEEALRIANRLVGNREEDAALEITLIGPKLRAVGDVDVAVVGGAFGPAPGRVLRLSDGDVVSFHDTAPAGSARAILAVAGGIDVPVVLGSRSTCFSARFGGFQGRRLQNGDELSVGEPRGAPRSDAAPALFVPGGEDLILRVLPGPQEHLFPDESRQRFYGSPYRLLPESNRIGFRLSGPPVPALAEAAAMASEGTAPGSVQITADGQPIVLLRERPTTGGYPKIATVAGAELPRLARARPGQIMRFRKTTIEEARRLLAEREEVICRWAES